MKSKKQVSSVESSKDSTQLLKELYEIINEKIEYTGSRKKNEEATNQMSSFVGTKAQYDAKFAEVLSSLTKKENAIRDEKNERVQSKWMEVQSSVEKEESVSNSLKLAKAWSIAWDKGHSAGYSEVVSEFRDLVELIKD